MAKISHNCDFYLMIYYQSVILVIINFWISHNNGNIFPELNFHLIFFLFVWPCGLPYSTLWIKLILSKCICVLYQRISEVWPVWRDSYSLQRAETPTQSHMRMCVEWESASRQSSAAGGRYCAAVVQTATQLLITSSVIDLTSRGINKPDCSWSV